MTINIALVTGEALVLGCDSIASATSFFLDPFVLLERGADGVAVLDDQGRATIRFRAEDVRQVVTSAWGGVTKMFQIHDAPCPVAAVTAGLAKLNNQNMATLASEFLNRSPFLESVEHVARAFLGFMREQFDRHYEGSAAPEQFRIGPSFLLGGYSHNDPFPSLYSVDVARNAMEEVYRNGQSGLRWGGQADAVQRLILGIDDPVRARVEESVSKAMKDYRDDLQATMLRILHEALERVGGATLDGIDTELPAAPDVTIPWGHFELPIDYANLPLQAAIDLVAHLVLIQSGRARFSEGVATVGGRIHIGLVNKDGFNMLNEPKLEHRYVGFGDIL